MKTVLVFMIVGMMIAAQTVTAQERKVVDKQFIAVSSFLVLSSIYDTETTFAALRNGGYEKNPIMRPFVKSGRPATYAFQLGLDALAIFLSYEMKKSHSNIGKAWWVLPTMMATGHTVAGSLNLRYAW